MQVKSEEKAYKLAKAIDKIEKECGVNSVRVTFKNIFVCPDIKFDNMLITSNVTYRIVAELLKKLQGNKESNLEKGYDKGFIEYLRLNFVSGSDFCKWRRYGANCAEDLDEIYKDYLKVKEKL